MQRGLDMLARALPEAAGGWIVLTQGAYSVSIHATYGRTEYQIEDANGTRIEHTDADFIVRTDEIILNGTITVPVDGMEIVKAEDTDSTYKVLPIPGGKCFSRDATETLTRIHTKKTL